MMSLHSRRSYSQQSWGHDCDVILRRGHSEELIKFRWQSGSSKMSKWAKKHHTGIVVAWPDGDAGNDPEAFGLAFHKGPTFIKACC